MAYSPVTATDLKTRFPAFATLDNATVELWLDDARIVVTDAWIEADRAPAESLLAAHYLTLNGHGASGGAVGNLAAMGVTDFKSASMSVSFDAGRVNSLVSGDYSATTYGAQFLVHLRRNRGGPRLIGGAHAG